MKLEPSKLKIAAFDQMNLPEILLKGLEQLKINKPTEIQARAIPTGINGHDLIAIAKTGSGKTLAYALSLLKKLYENPESRGLILTPSREMAQQVHKVMKALCAELAVDATLIIGGKGTGNRQSHQLKKKPRLIIATPGRLNDHLISNKLLLQGVDTVIVDEADRMLDMGFAPQLLLIRQTLRGNVQTLMFSASFQKQLENIAKAFLKRDALMIRTADSEAPVQELQQTLLYTKKEKKWDHILDLLNSTKGGVFIFTSSQESCESLAQHLSSYGYSVESIHGGLTQGQRNRTMRSFQSQETRILVSTDLLARGMDVPHVDHVINWELPLQSEDYLHRIGRTARAGRFGQAWTYITPADSKLFQRIKPFLNKAKEQKLDPLFNFEDRPPRRIDRMASLKGKDPRKTSQFSELKNKKIKEAPKNKQKPRK